MVGIQHISTIYEQMQLNQIPHITLLLIYHITTNSIIISYAQLTWAAIITSSMQPHLEQRREKSTCLSQTWLTPASDHGPCELLSTDQIWRRSDDSTWSWRRWRRVVEFCGDYSTRELTLQWIKMSKSTRKIAQITSGFIRTTAVWQYRKETKQKNNKFNKLKSNLISLCDIWQRKQNNCLPHIEHII